MNDLDNQKVRIKQKIDGFLGDEKVKKLLVNIIENKEMIKNIGFPVYILSGESGSGCTTFSKILAEIVDVYRILPKVSINNFIEMEYPYSDSKEEYNRFFESFRWAAETTNEFYGVALINISCYVRNIEDVHFLELLDFIKENKENTIFILRVNTFNEKEIDEIQAVIEKYSYTEHIELSHLQTEEYINYIVKKCKAGRMTFVPSEDIALKILKTYIDEAKEAKYFTGLHTINTFISFLAYNLMECKNDEGKIEITEENLNNAAQEFFSKMSINYNKIGFCK